MVPYGSEIDFHLIVIIINLNKLLFLQDMMSHVEEVHE